MAKTKYVIMIYAVNGVVRGMTNANKVHEFFQFEKYDQIHGNFDKTATAGMHNGVKGIFTATNGDQYVVYRDYSANRKEDTTEQGFPKEEFLSRRKELMVGVV